MAWQDRVNEIASAIDSGYTARNFLGRALVMLSGAYGTTDSYQVGPLGQQAAGANREYLDGIRARAELEYAKIPESAEPLPDGQRQQVAFQVYSIETACNQTISILGGGNALDDLVDSMKAPFRAGGLFSPPGGWWLWIAGAVALVIFTRTRST